MAAYGREDARTWAKEYMRGVCGCLLPTLNSSLTAHVLLRPRSGVLAPVCRHPITSLVLSTQSIQYRIT